jgi:large subunit ribosomal protein L18
MAKTNKRELGRQMRKSRIKKNLRGTDARPRLCVFRSLRYTYAQLISDETGKVLCGTSTRDFAEKSAGSVDSAKELGGKIAELAKEQKISSVVFDRNGYIYHGRVAAVAEGAREAGLQF